jgi:GntR family transcriptional regulator
VRIDPANPVPIFRQIADGVRGALAAGVFRPGDLIPSVRQQALDLLVNPNTVQRAYEELEREGLIVSRKGTGMVVAPRSKAAAQNGVEGAVRETLAHAARAAQAAEMTRAAFDRLGREAWDAAQ